MSKFILIIFMFSFFILQNSFDASKNLIITKKQILKIKRNKEIFIKSIKNIYNINNDILKYVFFYSKKYEIDRCLLLAIIKIESNFKLNSYNVNRNKSIDRGLCQLNSNSFKHLKKADFYNPEINIKYGAAHLKYCLDKAQNKSIIALAIYNAGNWNVINERIGEKTLDYIHKVNEEYNYLKNYY